MNSDLDAHQDNPKQLEEAIWAAHLLIRAVDQGVYCAPEEFRARAVRCASSLPLLIEAAGVAS